MEEKDRSTRALRPTTSKKPEDSLESSGFCHLEKRRLPTLPHCIAVPSAPLGVTSLFGMGRGGTPAP